MTEQHDEIITLRLPVWAFQGIMTGLGKWAGDHWDAVEIAHPIEFVEVPPSWQVDTEVDGLRYLQRRVTEADAPKDTADYGGPGNPDTARGPYETRCRNCDRFALDHGPARWSIYGACPPPTARESVDDPTTSRNAESSNAYDEQVMMPPETLMERLEADGRLWRLAFTETATAEIEASVRERVFADLAVVAHRLRVSKRPGETQTGYALRQVRAEVMSDAARIVLPPKERP